MPSERESSRRRTSASTPDGAVSAPARERRIQQYVDRALERDEAERRLLEARGGAGFRPPEAGVEVGLLSEIMDVKAPDEPRLIDKVLGLNHNFLLAGPPKVGKTRLGLTEMACCVDGLPFLGQETYMGEGERYCWFNGEMTKGDWDDYMRPLKVRNSADIVVLHLRGRQFDLLNDFVAEYVRDQLNTYEVSHWRIDSLRRVLAWSRIALNDNDGAGALTQRIDEIKRETNVKSCGIIAHIGRKEFEPGEEHVMGATEWDSWPDSRQVLTKDSPGAGARFFAVSGRQVGLETKLEFDAITGLYSAADGPIRNRRDEREENIAIAAEAIVGENPGITASALQNALGKKFNITNHNDKVGLVDQARSGGRIHFHKEGNSKQHYLGPVCVECQ
jgi:hypothetical protein